MKLEAIPLFSALRGRLGYLQQRQELVAQNVANSDTPKFTPRDLKPFKLEGDKMQVTPVATSAMHIAPKKTLSSQSAAFKSPDSETTLDGNQVVLEEQMLKMTDARMNYEAAIGFYQKSLGLIRLASRRPGG